MGLLDSIIGAESGGNPNATNPRSSAMGLGQFIAPTWLSTIKATRPDIAQGKTDEELLALRTDPQLSREMTQAYADQNQAILSKNGLPVTDGNTYLAHFAGPQGAVKVLQADPTASVGDILGPAVVQANPFLARMTAGDLQAWAAKKVGGSTPQAQPTPVSPAAPANGLLNASAAPAAPGLAPAAPAAPAGLGGTPAQGGFQVSDIQAPPIFYAPRKMPDLSKLRTAFKAPTFSRG